MVRKKLGKKYQQCSKAWGEMGPQSQMLFSTEAELCIKCESKRNKEVG